VINSWSAKSRQLKPLTSWLSSIDIGIVASPRVLERHFLLSHDLPSKSLESRNKYHQWYYPVSTVSTSTRTNVDKMGQATSAKSRQLTCNGFCLVGFGNPNRVSPESAINPENFSLTYSAQSHQSRTFQSVNSGPRTGLSFINQTKQGSRHDS
jgi:hypothetical protein